MIMASINVITTIIIMVMILIMIMIMILIEIVIIIIIIIHIIFFDYNCSTVLYSTTTCNNNFHIFISYCCKICSS